MKCLLRALIEGRLYALASLAKTGKCPLWQNFVLVLSIFVYYFELEVKFFLIIIKLAIL